MPVGKPRNDLIRQDVTDISSADQLLCYALAGQLEEILASTENDVARSRAEALPLFYRLALRKQSTRARTHPSPPPANHFL